MQNSELNELSPRAKKTGYYGFLIIFTWSIMVLFQALMWFSVENLSAALLVLLGCFFGIWGGGRVEVLKKYPITGSMIIGFVFYYFFMPPLATLIEFKPLTNNLDHPVLVFVHAVVCLGAIVFAHLIYRSNIVLQDFRHLISEKLFRPVGYFNFPPPLQLFGIGLIGVAATVIQVFILGAVQDENVGAGAGNRVMQALFPLTFIPYSMLVSKLAGSRQPIDKKWIITLAFYTGLLLLLSMGRNSRSAFLLGIMSVAMVYGFSVYTGMVSSKFLTLKNSIYAMLIALFISGPLSDFATSMVIAREQRSDINALDLVSETIRVFSDKEAIRSHKVKAAIEDRDWDELYVDNLFLSRLSNLKFSDQSIDLALTIQERGSNYYSELEFDKLAATLPKPILEFFDLRVDKDFVNSSSGGDLLLFSVTNSPTALGGFRTGSIFGSGYAMFGWFYPFVLFIACLLIFPLADAQTSRVYRLARSGAPNATDPIFSPMTISSYFTFVFFLTSAATGIEDMSTLGQFVIRGWVQMLIVYVSAYGLSYILCRPFMSRSY